jgi:uncharacterized protein (TIGR03067 family)
LLNFIASFALIPDPPDGLETLWETPMRWQLMTAVLIVAAPAPPEKDKKDEDKIQGTWAVVSIEIGGQRQTDEEGKNLKLVIKGDAITVNGPDKEEKAKFKLDAAKKPRTIDITPEEKKLDGKQVLGIYELNGDELKICYTEDGATRPTEFVSKTGSGIAMIVLKREK